MRIMYTWILWWHLDGLGAHISYTYYIFSLILALILYYIFFTIYYNIHSVKIFNIL